MSALLGPTAATKCAAEEVTPKLQLEKQRIATANLNGAAKSFVKHATSNGTYKRAFNDIVIDVNVVLK